MQQTPETTGMDTAPSEDIDREVRRILALPIGERERELAKAMEALADDPAAKERWKSAVITHLSASALPTVVLPLAGLRRFYDQHEGVMRAVFSDEEMNHLSTAHAVLAREMAKVACRYTFDVRLARHIHAALTKAAEGGEEWLPDIVRAVKERP